MASLVLSGLAGLVHGIRTTFQEKRQKYAMAVPHSDDQMSMNWKRLRLQDRGQGKLLVGCSKGAPGFVPNIVPEEFDC